jgi:hypothetical protein
VVALQDVPAPGYPIAGPQQLRLSGQPRSAGGLESDPKILDRPLPLAASKDTIYNIEIFDCFTGLPLVLSA